jgi:hypothetical protein
MTVKRPNGEVEVVEREGAFGNSAQFRKQATEATRLAGRGEILSFEVVANPAAKPIIRSEIERLRDQRRQIASDIQSAIEESDAAFERAHAREDVMAWEIKRQHDVKVEAVRGALQEFDAAHPDVVAAIRAEKQAAAERHMWD